MENQSFHACKYEVRSKQFFHQHSNSLNFDHQAIKPEQFKFKIYNLFLKYSLSKK